MNATSGRSARTLRHALAAALLLTTLLTALTTTGATPSATATAAAETEQRPRIATVLDSSGSMDERDIGTGGTRLDAAKDAVHTLIDGLPADAEMGVRAYGATYGGTEKSTGCRDSTALTKIAAMPDRPARTAAKQQVSALRATGFTPIGHALREAAEDLGTEGKRRIILVSDGEDTCAPPQPCKVAEELAGAGVDLVIDTLGFKVGAAAEKQLKCIAAAGGGSYTAVSDAAELSAGLQNAFRRSWKGYQVSGAPLTGGADCTAAPAVRSGRYLDHFDFRQHRSYRYTVKPGQGARFSATVVPRAEISNSTGVNLTVRRLSGTAAAPDESKEIASGGGYSAGWSNSYSGGVTVPRQGWDALPPGRASVELCVTIESLVNGKPQEPTELQFSTLHQPLTAAQLPPNLDPQKYPRVSPTSTSEAANPNPEPDTAGSAGPGPLLTALLAALALLLGAAIRVLVWRRRRN
jgi:Ca-activated chloride channel family protein